MLNKCTPLCATTLHATVYYGALHYRYATLHSTTLNYTQLHSTTLHNTILITIHYTTLHFPTLNYTTLHYTTLHYKCNYNYGTKHYTTLHYTTPNTSVGVKAIICQYTRFCFFGGGVGNMVVRLTLTLAIVCTLAQRLQRQFIFKRDSPSTTAAGFEITCLTHTDCCHLMVFASGLKVCVNVLTQNWWRLFSWIHLNSGFAAPFQLNSIVTALGNKSC